MVAVEARQGTLGTTGRVEVRQGTLHPDGRGLCIASPAGNAVRGGSRSRADNTTTKEEKKEEKKRRWRRRRLT